MRSLSFNRQINYGLLLLAFSVCVYIHTYMSMYMSVCKTVYWCLFICLTECVWVCVCLCIVENVLWSKSVIQTCNTHLL